MYIFFFLFLYRRPDLAFNWYTNPIKSMKMILVPQLKRLCLYFLVAICVVGFLLAILWALPGEAFKIFSNII